MIDRIFPHLEWRGECLEWTRSTTGGYGQIGERIDGRDYNRRVHRIVYAETIGDVGEDMVLHWCDNRRCCRPEHLHLGNVVMNAQECVERGRHPNANHITCPHGHDYTPENTYINPMGRRECKTCRRDRKRAARAAGATW